MGIVFNRIWAMPSADTFDIAPIGDLVRRYLRKSQVSVDPFARNKRWATYTNDLNPQTSAEHHMDAEEFCRMLVERGVVADLVIFDPPYSPRQIADCYSQIGRTVTKKDTQSAELYARVRHAIYPLVSFNGVVISCGWNSAGMGKDSGFVQEELLIVPHGGAHNDTLVLVERKTSTQQSFFGAFQQPLAAELPLSASQSDL